MSRETRRSAVVWLISKSVQRVQDQDRLRCIAGLCETGVQSHPGAPISDAAKSGSGGCPHRERPIIENAQQCINCERLS
jgi:hypothetical protein